MENLEKFQVKELSYQERSKTDGGWLWYAIGYAAGSVISGLDAAADWMVDNIEIV